MSPYRRIRSQTSICFMIFLPCLIAELWFILCYWKSVDYWINFHLEVQQEDQREISHATNEALRSEQTERFLNTDEFSHRTSFKWMMSEQGYDSPTLRYQHMENGKAFHDSARDTRMCAYDIERKVLPFWLCSFVIQHPTWLFLGKTFSHFHGKACWKICLHRLTWTLWSEKESRLLSNRVQWIMWIFQGKFLRSNFHEKSFIYLNHQAQKY